MKLKELHEELTKLLIQDLSLGDLEVSTEGCDCDGDVATVTVEEVPASEDIWGNKYPSFRYVYLKRSVPDYQVQGLAQASEL